MYVLLCKQWPSRSKDTLNPIYLHVLKNAERVCLNYVGQKFDKLWTYWRFSLSYFPVSSLRALLTWYHYKCLLDSMSKIKIYFFTKLESAIFKYFYVAVSFPLTSTNYYIKAFIFKFLTTLHERHYESIRYFCINNLEKNILRVLYSLI